MHHSVLRVGALLIDSIKDNKSPAHWWRAYGNGLPLIQSVAIEILSQTAAASACETSWSTFYFIYSKKRNMLSPSRLNDLVYVFSNLRLIDKLVDGKEKQCPCVDDVEAGEEEEEEEEGDIEGEELEVNEDDEMEPSQELDPNEFGLAAMEEEEEEGGGRRVSRRTSRGGRGSNQMQGGFAPLEDINTNPREDVILLQSRYR